MNDKLKTFLIGVLLLVLGALGYREGVSNLGGGVFATEFVTFGQTAVTTTPAVYLTAGSASSTLVFACANADQIDLRVKLTPSSTASILQWKYSFSDDLTVWYDETASTAATNVSLTWSPTALVNYWTPVVTSTQEFVKTNVAAEYCRITYSVVGANAAIMGGAVLKKGY